MVAYDADGRVTQIIEKPENPPSNYAVTGLYFLDETAPERARKVVPSPRGELEIVDLLRSYLDEDELDVQQMGRGYAWLDTGTHGSLLDAGNFVRTLSERQGQQVGCPEEVAFSKGWVSKEKMGELASRFKKTNYGAYLSDIGKSY